MREVTPRPALSYLGAKTKLVDDFRRIFAETWPDSGELTLIDAFAGTGVVTKHVGSLFKRAVANDQELYSRLVLIAQFRRPEDLEPWAEQPPTEGFITRSYCPRQMDTLRTSDRCFWTRENGQRLDGFREWAIRTLGGDHLDYALGCLIIAADRRANSCGGYWAYLRHFKQPSSCAPVEIEPLPDCSFEVEVRSEDATAVCLNASSDAVLYLDPPYGKRGYSNNYWLLNVLGSVTDAAIVEDRAKPGGITGMPVDRVFKKSVWNTRGAAAELRTILRDTPARRLAMSYSNDPANMMTVDRIQSSFLDCGWTVKRHEFNHTRYSSQNPSPLGSTVKELLFIAHRNKQ